MSTKHIPPWRDQDKADSSASAESDELHSHDELFDKRDAGFSRRRFIVSAAGVAGAAGLSRKKRGFLVPALADDDDERHKKDDRDGDADDASAPLPIPGGTILPFSTERYHFFFPPGTTSPVTVPPNPGAVDPSLITDFKGFIGLAHVMGKGTGTDTETGATSRFFFDTDSRFMKGTYVGMCDHEEHRGTFAFI